MRVEALDDCYVQLQFRKKGDVFDYNGPPNVSVRAVKGARAESADTPMSMEALTGAPREDVIVDPQADQTERPKPKRARNRIRLQSRPVDESQQDNG